MGPGKQEGVAVEVIREIVGEYAGRALFLAEVRLGCRISGPWKLSESNIKKKKKSILGDRAWTC